MDKPNQLFKAFSDETRLRILNLLALRPHCVCEFEHILRVPQPTVSRHLASLRLSGWVEEARHGKMIMYSLAEPKNNVHASLLRCVKNCFCEVEFLQRDLERAKKTKPILCA
jgi:ArsR family transcriptional regulator